MFNSLSKINPPAQNMPVRMEQKHGITKEREKKKIGQGAHLIDGGWIVDPDRIAFTAIQKFEVGRSIDGPITYLIGYASIIVAGVNCQQSWTFRLRPFVCLHASECR